VLDYGIDRNRTIIRQSLKEVQALNVFEIAAAVDDTLNYLERNGDADIVRDAMIQRFATYIKRVDGAGNDIDSGGFEVFTKEATAEQIEQGHFEVVTSGVGTKICNATRIFNNPTAFFDYVDEEEEKRKKTEKKKKPAPPQLDENGQPIETEEPDEDEEDMEDLGATVNAQREAGELMTALNKADFIAAAVETGPMLIGWSGGHFTYKPFAPTAIYFKYGDSVIDNGVERAPSYTSIEDAICVVVQLNSLANSTGNNVDMSQYLAIFGRSEAYPFGRYVQYEARKWDDIPDFGMPGAKDWTPLPGRIGAGKPANPLSWYAATRGNYRERHGH